MKIISVDAGKGVTNFRNEENKGRFISRYKRIMNKDYDLSKDNYIVSLDGERYLIGDLATNKDNGNKKNTILHKLCIYTAITKFLKPEKLASIKLSISCPISLYLNSEHKKEYADYIKNQGKQIDIEVNKEKYRFKIENLLISAEGSGFAYINMQDIKQDMILNVDMGNLNINIIGFKGGVPIPDSMLTLNIGYNTLRDMLNENLNQFNDGKKISDLKLDLALDNEVLSIRRKNIEESAEIIKKTKKDYLDKVINEITERTDMDFYDEIHFSGGVTNVISNYLNKSNWTIGNDEENVEGNFIRATNKWGDENN